MHGVTLFSKVSGQVENFTIICFRDLGTPLNKGHIPRTGFRRKIVNV